jgi:AsmA protein
MRWIIRILGVIFLLLILAVAAVFILPTDRIVAVATDRISAQTGRDVAVNGPLRPMIWPNLGVSVQAVEIGGPDWAPDTPLLRADVVSIRVPWAAVFTGQINIEDITVTAPEINLIRGADGQGNWDFGTAEPAQPNAAAQNAESNDPISFALQRAVITDAAVSFTDMATDQRQTVSGLNAELTLPATGQAEIALDTLLNGVGLDATMTLDDMGAFLAGEVQTLSAGLGWQGGDVTIQASVSLAPSFDGVITASGTDLSPLFQAARQLTPPELANQQFNISSRVGVSAAGDARLDDTSITLGDTQLDLTMDFAQATPRPILRSTLTGQIILPQSGSATTTTSTPAAGPQTGWSTDPIDLSFLGLADADVTVQLTQADLGNIALGPIDMQLVNSDRRAVLTIRELGLYDGQIAGDVVLNGRNGVSTRADIRMDGLEAGAAMRDFIGSDRVQGTAQGTIALQAAGNSMDALMRSLDGQGTIAMGPGVIRGFDLAAIIRERSLAGNDGSRSTTAFNSLGASFVITDGVLQNDDLRLDADWGQSAGEGQVNLGAQSINYRLLPNLSINGGETSITLPVLISGPWSDVSYGLDLEFLARQEIANQVDDITQEAQEAIEDRVRDQLGQEAEGLLDNLTGGGGGNALGGLLGGRN